MPIITKHKDTTGAAAASLDTGELGVNTVDGTLSVGSDTGNVDLVLPGTTTLPTGTEGQTLRNDSGTWESTSDLTVSSAGVVSAEGGLQSQGAAVGSFRAGLNAAITNQGVNAIAIGRGAGSVDQTTLAVSVGNNAGFTSQGSAAVAIGVDAGNDTQSQHAVAVGNSAGNVTQGTQSVAVGYLAGNSSQGTQSVAVGNSAGKTTQGNNAVAMGNQAGETTQGANSVAVGLLAGETSQGTSSVAVGYNAGKTTQGSGSVAIGVEAGQDTQSSQGVAIGQSAGKTRQKQYGVGIGYKAGEVDQGLNSIAIGRTAGQTAQGNNGIIINSSAAVLDDATNGHIHIASDDGSLDFLTASGWSMSDDLSVTGTMVASNASAASPSFSFAGDLDTGMYRQGANRLGFATGGVGRMFLESDGDLTVTGTVDSDNGELVGATEIASPTQAKVNSMMSVTQAEYDAIVTPDANTLYIII